MGYKHMTDPNQDALDEVTRDSVHTHNFNNLASSSTPSGMREDILLASWLIVLLRTREGERVAFHWSYYGLPNEPEEPIKHLSMGDVMNGLQDSIENVTATISSLISRADLSRKYAAPVSLLLSTSDTSQQSGNLTVRSSFTYKTYCN
jgi:hypothetical protein